MNNEDYELFLQHCKVVDELSGNMQVLLIQNSNEQMVCKTIPVPKLSEEQIQELNRILSHQKDLYHQNLLPVIDYHWNQKDRFIIFTEFYSHSLREQLNHRIQRKNPFSCAQLGNILTSITKGLRYLEQHLIGHGCITLDDIFIDRDGSFKVVDPSMASHSPFTFKQIHYYSPQLLQRQKKINFFKNDVFTLAMNMLELGLLRSVKGCFNGKTIDENILESYLIQFSKKYGYQLANTLFHMLNFDDEIRFSFEDILSISAKATEESEIYSESYVDSATNLTVQSFLLEDQNSERSPINEFDEQSIILGKYEILSNF